MARNKKIEDIANKSDAEVVETKGSYFVSDKPLDFISSGCQMLDLVLGGGYPVGRIVNLVGDKSTGKTLLAIELCANFTIKYPNSMIHYFEAEAAFDPGYAEALGLPIKQVEFVKVKNPELPNTVEGWFTDLSAIIERQEAKKNPDPVLYIVDSLDALSDSDELERNIDKGSYGAKKPKILSEIFRRLVDRLQKANILLFIISQVRDKIGVTFGDKQTVSGGKALEFYASQRIWLADTGKIKKTIRGVERPIGVNIKARCKKNKIGLPYRECEFPIIFGYGVDSLQASLDWVEKVKALDKLSFEVKKVDAAIKKIREEGNKEAENEIYALTKSEWREIETDFLPKIKKY